MMIKKPRKIGLGILTLSAAAFLTGCFGSSDGGDTGDTFIDDVPRQKFIGVVKDCSESSGVCDNGYYLKRDGADAVLLNSVGFNLGSKQYLGNEVEVSGVVNDFDGEMSLDVENIDVIKELEKEVKDEWETYSDAKHGFKIDYESSWEMKESSDGVEFAKVEGEEGDEKSVVEVAELPVGEPSELDGFLDLDNADMANLAAGFTLSKVGESQIAALRAKSENGGTEYFVPNGDRFLRIEFFSDVADVELKAERENTFFEMLLTFSLMNYGDEVIKEDLPKEDVSVSDENDEPAVNSDEADTTSEDSSLNAEKDQVVEVAEGFSPYESLPYAFQGQYPKNWYYSGQRSESSDIQHQYLFTDAPLDEGGEVLVELAIYNSPLPSGSTMTLGGKKAVVVTKGSDVEVYLERTEGSTYRFTGDSSLLDVIKDMASSVED